MRTQLREDGGMYRLFVLDDGAMFHRVSFVDLTGTVDRFEAGKVLRAAFKQVKATMPHDAVYYVTRNSGVQLIWQGAD